MSGNFSTWPISAKTGVLAFTIFTVFTLTSVALYPTMFNPLYMWLSNLGNVDLNPLGAVFFNLGCIITGIILLPFFIGLYQWEPKSKWSKILLIVGIVIGIFTSISLVMVGIFPETHIEQHMLAAAGVFGSLFLVLILLSLALFKHPKFRRWIAYYTIVPILIDLSFKYILSLNKELLAVFNPTIPIPAMEWASVFASLLWVLFLANNMIELGEQ
jgi:fluoride ion exporter CrcB/FEX